jgi:hypothetical protein
MSISLLPAAQPLFLYRHHSEDKYGEEEEVHGIADREWCVAKLIGHDSDACLFVKVNVYVLVRPWIVILSSIIINPTEKGQSL